MECEYGIFSYFFYVGEMYKGVVDYEFLVGFGSCIFYFMVYQMYFFYVFVQVKWF